MRDKDDFNALFHIVHITITFVVLICVIFLVPQVDPYFMINLYTVNVFLCLVAAAVEIQIRRLKGESNGNPNKTKSK